MFFPVETQPGNSGGGAFSLRDELLLHRDMAREAAKLITHVMTFVPGRSGARGGSDPRHPETSDRGALDPFWKALQAVARCSRSIPVTISSLASLSLAEGARESDTTLAVGSEGSCVLATSEAAKRLTKIAESVQSAHYAVGGSIETIVARHLNDCVVDYRSSTIGQAVGDIDFAYVSRSIDREVAAAITWAAKYLTDQGVSPPEEPSAATRPVVKAVPNGGQEMVIALLRDHHSEPDARPLQGRDIAELAMASPSTVSRAIKKVFGEGGHAAYRAACERGDVSQKLAQYDGSGIAFGASANRSLDR